MKEHPILCSTRMVRAILDGVKTQTRRPIPVLPKEKGQKVVCLLPARTDTRWWHDYCTQGEITFLKGRLKFSNAESNAPFPNAIVVFRPRVETILKGTRYLAEAV